jgi:flagellar protein FliO/FliZ
VSSPLALPRPTRARLALWSAAALGLLVALAPGELAPASLRAAAAAAALGAAGLLARAGVRPTAAGRRLALVSRQALSREAGVALLEVDGRPVLVGFAAAGVQLLQPCSEPTAGLTPPAAPEARP